MFFLVFGTSNCITNVKARETGKKLNEGIKKAEEAEDAVEGAENILDAFKTIGNLLGNQAVNAEDCERALEVYSSSNGGADFCADAPEGSDALQDVIDSGNHTGDDLETLIAAQAALDEAYATCCDDDDDSKPTTAYYNVF